MANTNNLLIATGFKFDSIKVMFFIDIFSLHKGHLSKDNIKFTKSLKISLCPDILKERHLEVFFFSKLKCTTPVNGKKLNSYIN